MNAPTPAEEAARLPATRRSGPGPALSYSGRKLSRYGRPHRILAGAMHYFRIHPELWEDRIARLAAMGVNTLDTYVAWNFHQPTRGVAPDFTGWRDLARFITLAGDAGLDVIVRPGPYICAEWDNGGFPAWAIADPEMVLRSSDPRFTRVVGEWFDGLLPVLVPLQASHGGPVVAVQIENEYGSYGDDAGYLRWNRAALQSRGITEMLFTADGGTDYFLDGGALPDTWAAATLGSGGDAADAVWRRRRPGEPFFNVEFWNGWFDHWGEEHHTRGAADAAADVAKILDLGGSVCLYMAHGGTNFGLTSGCNHDGAIQPTVTSYDSDAPIGEDGRLTDKFHAMRKVFHAAAGREPAPLPEALARPAAVLPASGIDLTAGTGLLELVRAGEAAASIKPLSFEQLGLDRGLVHHTATAVLPIGGGTIRIRGLHDRAYLWIDGVPAGVLTDSTAEAGLTVAHAGGPAVLEILVENQGRINYGPLFGQGKGILGGVLVNQRYVFHWEQRALDPGAPLAELLGRAGGRDSGSQDPGGEAGGRGLFHGSLHVDGPADTHLALPGFVKGFAWVNGFLLGRYWEVGPQHTLYVPAPLLRPGTNRITVLELEHAGTQAQFREAPELGARGATHVEDLG
ncbi:MULTISPECIES: glycoside hydrolase family 35 protein [unclassified Arthrobacter]|uniref:glycoside hydrolase family 35 protein n=1 Tax=unclassified Arthrobacter TaxID=235627 RepID=UPI00159D7C5E|nr:MULTISPECIES: glycoside hydrolase family 35 protein [unclassified Arthrobacter]MCQ9165839.1 beta-galactosidase [Arthrobacter sp. STN4]NVM99724.1 beta-galactosidase [Arthrobacter sp. SDTb3-6]